MRARSLWTNIQGIPDPVFHLQGASSQRPVRKIQQDWGLLGFRARFAGSKRDSGSTQRVCSKGQQRAQKTRCKISRSSQGSEEKIELPCRNSQTTQRVNG